MTTTYFKNLIMGNVFKTKTSPALPTTYYIGLSKTAPNVSGGNVSEPSATNTGYARVQLTASNMGAPSNGAISNTASISFPEATATWFTSSAPASHYVIYDAKTGGNLLLYNALTATRVIEANTVATIKKDSLHLQLTD